MFNTKSLSCGRDRIKLPAMSVVGNLFLVINNLSISVFNF